MLFGTLLGTLFNIAAILPSLNYDLIEPKHLKEPIEKTSETTLYDFLSTYPSKNYKVHHNPHYGKIIALPNQLDEMPRRNILRGNIHESHVYHLIKKHIRPGTTVIDVGAHMGHYTIPFSRYAGPNGLVIAFEPQRSVFWELAMNATLNHLNNVKLYNYALSNEEKYSFMLHDAPVMNKVGFLNSGENKISDSGKGNRVKIKTLDSFNFTNVSLIKIDVEGLEIDVIEGSKDTIARYKPILLVEICGGNPLETASNAMKKIIYSKIDAIENLGYKVNHIRGHDYIATPI